MATIQLEQFFGRFESVTFNHLVYEADDEALLFSCVAVKNGKTYHSKFPIDFTGLNIIIGKLSALGIDVYDQICESLFESTQKIREYQFQETTLINTANEEFSLVA